MEWADEFRGKFGAEGIGLCRTEHMAHGASRKPIPTDDKSDRPVLLHDRGGFAGELQHPGGEDAQEEGAERGHE